MTIALLDPTVHPDPSAVVEMAPRPASLAGKRVGLVDNGKANSAKLLQFLVAAIGKREPLLETVLVTKPAVSRGVAPEVVAQLQTQCDVAIAGTGD